MVILDKDEHLEVSSINDAGGSSSFGLEVIGEYAYVNTLGAPDPDPNQLLLPGSILEVDLLEKAVVDALPVGRGNLSMAFARNKLYTANAFQDNVTVVDIGTRDVATILLGALSDFPVDIDATPDGSRVFVGDQSGYVFRIDTESGMASPAFRTVLPVQEIATADDFVYVIDIGGTVIAFERQNDDFVQRWFGGPIGQSFSAAIAARQLFSGSRSQLLPSISLDPPHEVTRRALGTGARGRLWDVIADDGLLYIAGESGVLRFDTADETDVVLSHLPSHGVKIGPCPRSFAGDADCDRSLSPPDVAAAIIASFDKVAHLRCDADCNADGRAGAADITCTVRMLP
jgi:hypothetical protein